MAFSTFPNPDEFAPYYSAYIADAQVDDIKASLRENRDEILSLFENINEEAMNFRYREGSWDLKELIQHVIDAERVFAYRALCIARGDEGPFPGFDENAYVAILDLGGVRKDQLMYDFVMARNSFISQLTGLREHEWTRKGIASGHGVSVRALAHMALGHSRHHINVVRDRYLANLK